MKIRETNNVTNNIKNDTKTNMTIKLENVNYIYNEGLIDSAEAVKDINLEIGGDSFIALIGSTGSGKSTLIQLLDGLIKPSSGKIYFDGEDLYSGGNEKEKLRALRKKTGLVFQYPENQLFEETVLKDVAFGPKNQGHSEEEAKNRATSALLSVGISKDMFEKSPFELSGGEMRRVAIAGILAMEPELLILDEPTAGLDPKGKQEILDLVGNVRREKHASVVFVSHNMEEVADYADRVIAMHHGNIIFDGETHEVFSHFDELEKIGLKEPEVSRICRAVGIENVITVDEAAEALAKKYFKKFEKTD